MRKIVRLYAVSDEDYAVQRFYTEKIFDAGFDVRYKLDEDGEKASYLVDFDLRDLPKLMKAVDEEIIISYDNNELAITIYDMPFC